jgi:hypothetical protein
VRFDRHERDDQARVEVRALRVDDERVRVGDALVHLQMRIDRPQEGRILSLIITVGDGRGRPGSKESDQRHEQTQRR